MTLLDIPDERRQIADFETIQRHLAERQIRLERWPLPQSLAADASSEAVLDACEALIKAYAGAGSHSRADVVSLQADTPNLAEIRAKFLKEHTHSEDEVRFFLQGSGAFWFHLPIEGAPGHVFKINCEQGDLLSVPAGMEHWFDCGAAPSLRAVRIFGDPAGWVPRYTGSGREQRYGAIL